MSAAAFIDTSVLVAAMVADEPHHTACGRLLDSGKMGIYAHGIAETFSTMTGGRKAFRLTADSTMEILEEDFLPCLEVASLTTAEMIKAMRGAQERGVRGGAIFDYLHLMAARKAKATRFYTLNLSHFRAFHRHGDPQIVHP